MVGRWAKCLVTGREREQHSSVKTHEIGLNVRGIRWATLIVAKSSMPRFTESGLGPLLLLHC
jgi:hypothetical protein